MISFSWDKIIGSFKGFEKLAVDYVRDHFSDDNPLDEYNWNPTKATRDGNKDAVKVFIFQSEQKAYFWMEAKYSQYKKNISRYKLDSTIVSAILDGNVRKVIFVTNMQISNKNIIDIKDALDKSCKCEETYFCTKNHLEKYLSENLTVFKKYFPEDVMQPIIKDIFFLNDLEIYKNSAKAIKYCESLKFLCVGDIYNAYFSVIKPKNSIVNIVANKNYENNIHILNQECNEKDGVCVYIVKFEILNISRNNGSFEFFLDLVDDNGEICDSLRSYKTIKLIENDLKPLRIESQDKALSSFIKEKDEFAPKIINIYGKSGVGKGYLVEKFLSTEKLINFPVFVVDVEVDKLEAIKNIIEFLEFIFVPFVEPKNVNITFIESQPGLKNYFPTSLISFIKEMNDGNCEYILKNFNKKFIDDIVTKIYEIGINFRVLVVKNIHHADMSIKESIVYMMKQFINNKIPIISIITSDALLKENKVDEQFIYNYELNFSESDFINNFKSDFINTNLSQNPLYHIYSSHGNKYNLAKYDLLYPLTYKKFKKLYHYDTPDEIDIILALKTINDNIKNEISCEFEKYLNEINCDEYINVLDIIYFGYCDLFYSYLLEKNIIIQQLLQKKIIKTDISLNYAPYLSEYKKIYFDFIKKNPSKFNHDLLFEKIPKERKIQINLYFADEDSIDLGYDINELKSMYKEQKYHSIHYILEPIFCDFEQCFQNNTMLRNNIGADNFFVIFYLFAYSSANVSKTVSSTSIFTFLYNEIETFLLSEHISNETINKIHILGAYELLNSAFENFNYEDFQKLYKKIKSLSNTTKNVNCDILKYSEYLNILYNMDFEGKYDCAKIDQIDNDIYRHRYARCLFVEDAQMAYKIIEIIKNKISETDEKSKFNILLNVDYYFLEVIYKGNMEYVDIFIRFAKELSEDFYNDFKKVKLAIAGFYLCDKYYCYEKAKEWLSDFILDDRNLRPRQKGFLENVRALIFFKESSFENAIKLINSSKQHFKNILSYYSIVEHNEMIILTQNNENIKIDFYLGGDKKNDTLYIDPRIIW